MKNDYKFTSEDQTRDMWSKRQKTLVFFSVCVSLSLSCTCVVESRVFVKPIVSHSVHGQTAIVWIQRKWQISSCKKPTGVCSNAKTSVVRRASSISREMWLLSTQQAFSKPQCLFTSSTPCFLTNSPQYFSTSAPPKPSHALFTLMFVDFLPSCAWSIKHTCVLAPYTPQSSCLAPRAKSLSPRWGDKTGWPFQSGRKWLQSRPSLTSVSCVSNLVSKRKSLYLSHT